MHKITDVVVGEGYTIRLRFEDGVEGAVDLSCLVGRGVFAQWEDHAAFRDVGIGETGDLRWAHGVDLCPDALYLKVTGKTPEQAFPELTSASRHA
jgi:hypothetical protein